MTGRLRYAHLQDALPDARGHRVVFVSHCLLNQNTRYLGGAVCPGVVPCAIAPYVDAGVGIVQLPCPEQLVWGGVLKSHWLWVLEHRWVARAGPVLVRCVRPYLRHRYARLARSVAAQIEDYLSDGFTLAGVVGVAGSPTCGVRTTVSLRLALAAVARNRTAPVTTGWLNDTVIAPALGRGTGLFIEALNDELGRRHLAVPVTEQALPRFMPR